jgi:hypothetical protein
MMRLLAMAMLAFLAILPRPAGAAAEKWTHYANPRFGTFAEYPSGRFEALPPPENGDGQSFKARDGAALAIFGSNNIDDFTPASYETFLRSGDGGNYAHVTYRASGDDWLVLSGLRGNDVFYEKYLFRGDITHGLVVTYPQTLKAEYNPIAARIAKSLGAGRVEYR